MKSRAVRRGISLSLLILLLLTVVPPLQAQEPTSDAVLDLMAQMSPEAKVGQLVLVTFPGTEVGDDSEIAQLIRDYWIGGVLFKPENGNFGSDAIAPTDLLSVTQQLQSVAWDATVPQQISVVGETEPYRPPYVPLLVAVSADETGLAPTSFVSGTSPLPTQLALGATWDPALSREAGTVLGRELTALGFNLYLGPNLDVLYTPRPGDPADLGTRVFGGDPFWVGEMGTAFIEGLHEGGVGQLLVAPRHLPGLGSADRPLEDEVPTVHKPLEQLKQIELAPFFAAAKEPPGSSATADAFLVTHIRYRGFQGNIRQTTRPISLDAQALQLVTSLEEVAPWRSAGGVLIADNLAMGSIHRLYDPRGTFNPRRVTQDALTAGNDLLILDQFATNDVWDLHFANIRDTLKFLASQYKDEPAFKTVVDDAVYRILSMKMRLYPDFSEDAVMFDADDVTADGILGSQELVNAQVALNALTLIFPLTDDLLPSPPEEGESIVVFTQESAVDVGDSVASLTVMDDAILADTLMRFYGPSGTGVVRLNAVQSFTFSELRQALDVGPEAALGTSAEGETPEPADPVAAAIFEALRQANWIVFAPVGLDAGDPDTLALKRFLSEQANLLDGQIAVLAFGPPYELDSTEISKLDLYYGLFSTGTAFVEAGVRALFRALPSPGNSPVDIPDFYYVPIQTMPQEQVVPLMLVDGAGEEFTPTARSQIHIGDLVYLRTGVIVDRNGHIVPDGTPVQFTLTYPQDGSQQKMQAVTSQGVAEIPVTIDRVGQLDIIAQSEPSVSSVRLELTIRDDGVTVNEVEPTPTMTVEPTPTPTSTPEPSPTLGNPVPSKISQLPDHLQMPSPRRGHLMVWGASGVISVFLLGFLWAREQSMAADDASRVAFLGIIGSLVGYIVLMMVGRWWLPVVHYALIGREYLAGVATGGIGTLTILSVFWVMMEKITRLAPSEPPPASYPSEEYSRSRL